METERSHVRTRKMLCLFSFKTIEPSLNFCVVAANQCRFFFISSHLRKYEMGTALKSVTAHLLTEFWLQNMRGMFIVALSAGCAAQHSFYVDATFSYGCFYSGQERIFMNVIVIFQIFQISIKKVIKLISYNRLLRFLLAGRDSLRLRSRQKRLRLANNQI